MALKGGLYAIVAEGANTLVIGSDLQRNKALWEHLPLLRLRVSAEYIIMVQTLNDFSDKIESESK